MSPSDNRGLWAHKPLRSKGKNVKTTVKVDVGNIALAVAIIVYAFMR
jgi:hypothetical protein